MAASNKRIRDDMRSRVQPTPRDAGLQMRIDIVAYGPTEHSPHGIVQVNGVPMSESGDWSGAMEVVAMTLNEFRRQANRYNRKFGTTRAVFTPAEPEQDVA